MIMLTISWYMIKLYGASVRTYNMSIKTDAMRKTKDTTNIMTTSNVRSC